MKCRQVYKCNNGYFAIYYIELPLSIIIVTIYLVIYGLFCSTNYYHPSGSPQASEADLLFTRRLIKCGDLMGIDILDHLIIGDNAYVSLREEGLWQQEDV